MLIDMFFSEPNDSGKILSFKTMLSLRARVKPLDVDSSKTILRGKTKASADDEKSQGHMFERFTQYVALVNKQRSSNLLMLAEDIELKHYFMKKVFSIHNFSLIWSWMKDYVVLGQ